MSSVTIGLLVAPALQADAAPAAEPAVAVAPAHGSYQNGCGPSWASWIPDSGPTFNFHSACDWHDLCYHYRWYSRLGCDNGFLNRMYSSCQNRYGSWDPRRYSCYHVANNYYAAVRAGGWGAW